MRTIRIKEHLVRGLRILAKNSMTFYLLISTLAFAYIIYFSSEVKYCIKLPIIAAWLYMAINVGLNYDEECAGGEKVDRTLISYVLLICALIGAFFGAYIDLSAQNIY
jgi:hypothetical protein